MKVPAIFSVLRNARPTFIASRIASYSAYASRTYATENPIAFPGTAASSRDDVPSNPITTPDVAHIYHIHVKSSRNNTLIALSGHNPKSEGRWGTLYFISGGKLGFKGVQRSGYEAGYQCAIQIFQKVHEEVERLEFAPMRIHLFFNGFGQGREAVFRALMANEGMEVRNMVARVTDKTPIKIGGARSKKRRVL